MSDQSKFFGVEEFKELEERRKKEGYQAPTLTEVEQAAIEKKRAALTNAFGPGEELIATYKIELNFEKGRSVNKPFAGSLVVWRSGSALGGGGDEIMYPCPDDRCIGFIPPELISAIAQKAGCPKCQKLWHQNQLMEMRLFKLPVHSWSVVVTKYFIRLNHDADIYIKTHPIDIRSQTLKEQMRDRGGEELLAARMGRIPVIYPLDRIFKDLSAGADLEKRFRAFLEA